MRDNSPKVLYNITNLQPLSRREDTIMRRLFALLLCAALLLALTGCSKAAGGSYKLEYITADGVRMLPSSFGMNITLDLEEDGVGTANYSGTVMDITWTDEGKTVLVTGPKGELEFRKDGKNLILHDNGTLLFFTLVETDD